MPVQERVGIGFLGLDVDGFVVRRDGEPCFGRVAESLHLSRCPTASECARRHGLFLWPAGDADGVLYVFASCRRGGNHAEFLAFPHESGRATGKENRGEDAGDLLVMNAVSVTLPGTDVVVVVEDEERLRAIDLGLGFVDEFAETRGIKLVMVAVESDEHVHGELQLVVFGTAVPVIERSRVGEIGFADKNALVGVCFHHGPHATDDIVNLGQVAGVDVLEVGITLGVDAAGLRVRRGVGGLQREWEWHRDGSRLRHGRARNASRRSRLFRRRGCSS